MQPRLLPVCLLLAAPAWGALTGTVQDASGSPIADATVELLHSGGAVLARFHTGATGEFEWHAPAAGRYRVRVSKAGLATREQVVAPDAAIRIVLDPEALHTRLTVSATRGAAEPAESSPLVLFTQELTPRTRPLPSIGHALEAEPGVLVQQSTTAQVSPFLRGLTGYHVLHLVDGIRFNNSTFRSGPNQYLALLEPGQAQRVEAMLGPAGVAYGSDSLGGAIHVLTPEPRFDPGAHGELSLGGAGADLSATASARLALSRGNWYWLGGLSGRRLNDLRAGGGYDSRNVFHRLFGIPLEDVRDLLGPRLQDTGFRQYGVVSKLALRPREDHLLSFNYLRGVQEGVRGYKDLLGGLGRMLSTFEPQTLDFFYARYEKLGAGPLDSASLTASINRQVDGGSRQGLRASNPVTRDRAEVTAYGYTVQATSHWHERAALSFGSDIYDETIASSREVWLPASGARTHTRPLYPNGSRYTQTGLFGQASFDPAPAVRLGAGARFTAVRFATREDAALQIPALAQWFRDVTFHTSLRWQFTRMAAVHAVVSRGFRAPNLNDLGALGLNDLGYEVPSAAALTAGALLSTDAGEGALPAGRTLRALAAESLMNYEVGLRLTGGRTYARVQGFASKLEDPVVRRTLLFPANAIPSAIAGIAVQPLPQTPAQRAAQVATVATALDPRAVKSFVNDGEAIYYGLEAIFRQTLRSRWTLEVHFHEIAGRQLHPNRALRRLPPRMGGAVVRHTPSGRRPWFELSALASGRQDRLSGGDRDDERIGASFRRRDIADFFRGDRVAPYLDGAVFRPTGETLAQIQDRVLPLGAALGGVRVVNDDTRVPLYLSTAGWMTLSVRTGLPLTERWQAAFGIENLLDRNYRVHGSGVDAPGFNAWAGFTWRF